MNRPINNRTSEINKLQGEYLSSNLNQVWTVDITSIKQRYFFFFVLDLASRRVVYYDLSPHDYTSTEATLILVKALKQENSVIPSRPVKFVHTDSGAIFLSKEWIECLKVNDILPSSSDSKNHQNQVSERFNRTFKKLLRDYLNKKLNKTNNKTNTFQLIGEATKYNFENFKKITEEIIVYYNSEKPHNHLNDLPPDTWANRARLLPEHKYIVKDKHPKEQISSEYELDHKKSILELPQEVLINTIETIQNTPEVSHYKNMQEKDPKAILENMLDLKDKLIIPFVPLSKNDNSETAKMIRKYKNNVGSLELINHIKENKIDLSKLDLDTKKMYQSMSEDVYSWQNTDIKYLETLMLQNQILLLNIEELKQEFKTKTDQLKLQNEELLSMNHYLVETAEKAEEERQLALERKLKRQKAKKLAKRDYITTEEFYEIMFSHIFKCEDSMYIISRNRIAFFIMYFTGLRVSNLLLLNVRNIKELMYNKLGTEIPIIKRGRPNQLISLGDNAQTLLANDFFDDIACILKDKDDDNPAFTAEKNISTPLHRVTFTQSLNNTLKYSSNQFHKNISCHSFRATFITEGIIQNIPIHVMQKAVGHKNIQSTEHYIRHDLSVNEWKKVLTATNAERASGFAIKLQENQTRKQKRSLQKSSHLTDNYNSIE